ncbi:MAG: hypothetical protein JWR07_1540 [Nevskia sp.]|nr:hypothetical protein [Nevskia sp.]
MDHREEGTLFVAGVVGGQLVPVSGGVTRTTTAPRGNRGSDRVDCAFWVPPQSAMEAFGDVQFLSEARLSRELPTPDTLYTAYGYPISRNKKMINHVTKSIDTRISMYTANVAAMPDLAAKLGVSGEAHLFLSFTERSYSGDGADHNTFGPRGLSGGALLRLGEFSSPDSFDRDPRLAISLSGMIIEHHKDHGALVAVRIGAIVDGIRSTLKR